MAIRKTIEKTIDGFNGSIFCKDAYLKVVDIAGTKQNIKFRVCSFSNNVQIDEEMYSFSPSVENGSKNFIAQAYEYLKTLPEFEGATDC